MSSVRALLCCVGLFGAASHAGDHAQPLSLGDFPGVWQMRGYGSVLDVSATRVVRYDLTDISCIRVEDQPLAQAATQYDRLEAEPRGFSLFESGGITRYALHRLSHLPQRCEPQAEHPIADPELNFSVFWQAFRENYAFFDLRKIDWDQIYKRFRPDINASSSEADLFKVFSAMLDALHDRHVTLRAGERGVEGGGLGELKDMWLAENGKRQAEEEALSGYRAAVHAHIVDDILHGKATQGANGAFAWGWAARGVGYVNVATMRLLDASGQRIALTDQIAMVDDVMARALRDLRGARALIVDARFNGGGNDAVALRIMGSFTGERRLAFTKKAVEGAGFTDTQSVYFAPTVSAPFTGPIFYLQSGNTVSAAEIFTFAMMALPNVTRIGTRTYGVLSDMLNKRLPNGWSFSLSNEIYLAVDGKLYEGLGIPPTLQTDTSRATDFRSRLQLDVDAALLQASRTAH